MPTDIVNLPASSAIPDTALFGIYLISSGSSTANSITGANLKAALRAALIPALPVWAFGASDGSDPASGHFTTNQPDQSATSQIIFSNTAKDGSNSWANMVATCFGSTTMVAQVTDSLGRVGVFHTSNFSTDGAGNLTMTGSWQFNNSFNWAGDYSVLLMPTPS